MQQFVVPQFIDVEDKIFGPITVRQFLILLVAGLLIFISYRLADFILFIILTVVIGGIALIFAFFKYNGQNFHYIFLYIIQFVGRPARRIWRKEYDKSELEYLRKEGAEKGVETEIMARKKPHRKHISDLALIVNTGGYYRGEANDQ